MKKIGVIIKEISQSRIKTNLKNSDTVFIINYSGLSSPDLTSLRGLLKGAKTDLFVVKNTVARRALKDSGLDLLVNNVEGPCGLVFAKDEPVLTSKVLCEFAKEHKSLKLQGGSLHDRILQASDIEVLSKLPSRDVLRAQLVCTLNAPIAHLAMALNQVIGKFVVCLDQIKQKKAS